MQTSNGVKIKLFYYLIFFGVFFSLGMVGYVFMLPTDNFRYETLARDKIIAPYYKAESFKKPNKLPIASKSVKSVSAKAINLPILMYHYVEDTMPKQSLIRKKLTINPKIFEEQLKSLSDAGFKFYFVRDIPGMLSGQIKPDKKSVVLTFDDGYKDFYSVVLPLLKKYQAKATVYVITNTIGGEIYLSDADLKELRDSGIVEIGSHTLDHVMLKEKSGQEAERQIVESKKGLEKRLGIIINTLAYPYGSFSAETVKLVQAAGYTAAVSVIPGRLQSADNLFYLSRLRPGERVGKELVNFAER